MADLPPLCSVGDAVTQRRLASQDRQDNVNSRRDYQQIQAAVGARFVGYPTIQTLMFSTELSVSERGLAGVGGYLFPSRECRLTVSTADHSRDFHLLPTWNRFGLAIPWIYISQVGIRLDFTPGVEYIEIWGFDAGPIELPSQVPLVSAAELSKPHLAPETFFLAHDAEISIPLRTDLSSPCGKVSGVHPIALKKCSYCGRFLPLDVERPSALAFHKHRAKLSGHQNECRACKAWRINQWFNPKRTNDQFHESSTINRERKLFLQEPEILQRIKDKEGRGLKSIVWEKFGRKCFKCGVLLDISEVQVDHTRPFSYLWSIDEHATCLCSACNNHKKDRFPVDFYSYEEIVCLSTIIGLPVQELCKKEVCQPQLQRIVREIEVFACVWDPRTFNAVARKVRELTPIDLYEVLWRKSPSAYELLQQRLKERPPAIGEDDELLFEDEL